MQLFYYIHEMEINYNKNKYLENAFEHELTSRIRNTLASSETIDDGQAMETIANEVFNDAGSEEIAIEDLDLIIKKIFFRTRKKTGILTPLIEDKDISEIMVNGPENIFYEKKGAIFRYDLAFDSYEELEDVIRHMAAGVHREFNELNPIVDARLPDGSRVNGVYKNVAVNGPILTIRKFSDDCMTIEDLTANGTLTRHAAELLTDLVSCRYNLFVSGGTSSGKTTLLNALSHFIGRGERVIIIEDSAELQPGDIENIVRLECRRGNISGKGAVDMSRLIRTSLRMRPDRIIVGEVRGGEVLDMLQAMNTGHAGSMSTGHGNSTDGMLKRLETMYLMAAQLSIDAVRSQIAQAIEIMVHTQREGETRRVTEISELCGYENGSFIINRIMETDQKNNLVFTGNKIKNDTKLRKGGKEPAYGLSGKRTDIM